MGFVNDDGVFVLGDFAFCGSHVCPCFLWQSFDTFQHERKLLQRGDNDAAPFNEGIPQLPGVLVNLLHHPRFVLKLVNSVLQLPIQNPTVGNDHHRIEHLLIVCPKAVKPIGQPRDGVAFAAPRRMLDKVIFSRAVCLCIGFEFSDGGQLVVPGKNDALFLLLFSTLGFYVRFQVDEPPHNVEPTVSLLDFFPQVGGLVAVGVERIARPAIETFVKGEKAGFAPIQKRGEIDLIRIHRKMNQCPFFELEKQFGGVSVFDVLAAGMGGILCRELIF